MTDISHLLTDISHLLAVAETGIMPPPIHPSRRGITMNPPCAPNELYVHQKSWRFVIIPDAQIAQRKDEPYILCLIEADLGKKQVILQKYESFLACVVGNSEKRPVFLIDNLAFPLPGTYQFCVRVYEPGTADSELLNPDNAIAYYRHKYGTKVVERGQEGPYGRDEPTEEAVEEVNEIAEQRPS